MDWPGRDGDRLSYSPDASVLLVIPGIIVAVVFGVYGWALVDKALDPIEALRHSSRITRGHRGQVFAFALIAIVLNIVGVLLMIVGVLVTSAVTLIAAAHVYGSSTGCYGRVSPTLRGTRIRGGPR